MNETMRKVKKVELEILQEFECVCEMLNLRWYAGYGTVLGAIRHKGFIPWDDDVDVLMPRKDYEIFCKKAQELLPEKYFVQTLETEEEYYQPFAKVRRSDTTFWEKGTEHDNINHGIYIDIFPLDGYPTKWFAEKLFMIKRIIYNNFLYEDGDLNCLSGYRKVFAVLYRVFRGKLTRKEAAFKKEKLVKKVAYDEAEIVSCMVEDTPKAEAVLKSVYGEGLNVPFEDREIKVPTETHEYLTRLYGSYMEFPPEDKRIPIHSCILIDAEKSYLDYEK